MNIIAVLTLKITTDCWKSKRVKCGINVNKTLQLLLTVKTIFDSFSNIWLLSHIKCYMNELQTFAQRSGSVAPVSGDTAAVAQVHPDQTLVKLWTQKEPRVLSGLRPSFCHELHIFRKRRYHSLPLHSSSSSRHSGLCSRTRSCSMSESLRLL